MVAGVAFAGVELQGDNLYVIDGSFMPSIGAVNPTLTIIAYALRVAEHIAGRLTA